MDDESGANSPGTDAGPDGCARALVLTAGIGATFWSLGLLWAYSDGGTNIVFLVGFWLGFFGLTVGWGWIAFAYLADAIIQRRTPAPLWHVATLVIVPLLVIGSIRLSMDHVPLRIRLAIGEDALLARVEAVRAAPDDDHTGRAGLFSVQATSLRDDCVYLQTERDLFRKWGLAHCLAEPDRHSVHHLTGPWYRYRESW